MSNGSEASSGDFDPKLTSLYPESSDPAEIHHTLVRHARQHEMSLATIQQHYRLLKSQGVTLQRVDDNLRAFIASIEMERVEKKLQEARGEYSLKKMTAILGFVGALVGALATAAVTYATKAAPEAKPATAEQLKALDKGEALARHEPAPSKAFNAIVDADGGPH